MGREARTPIDKRAAIELLRRRLAERLDALTASQKTTQQGAVHPEGKQEHAKDTRAIEQVYLARGLAERVETLRDGMAALAGLELRELAADDAVGLGTLVGLRDEEERELVFLLSPAGAGERLEVGSLSILVVTPHAPLGASLVGLRVGDEIEVEIPAGKRWFEVRWLG
jgi:transcription elongation GreA/GreB family factor